MVKCNYINEKEFNDFKENFHTLIETLNHNVTKISSDVNSMKINTAVMTNSMKNMNKIIWGVVGVLSAIGLSVITAILTKMI